MARRAERGIQGIESIASSLAPKGCFQVVFFWTGSHAASLAFSVRPSAKLWEGPGGQTSTPARAGLGIAGRGSTTPRDGVASSDVPSNLARALRAAMGARNAQVQIGRPRVTLAVTCHQLHHATGQNPQMRRAVSKRLDSPVAGDVVDLTTRHADVHQLPVTQIVQGG